jgi:hypothetical protein
MNDLSIIKVIKYGMTLFGKFELVDIIKVIFLFILAPIYLLSIFVNNVFSFILIGILYVFLYYFFMRKSDNKKFINFQLMIKYLKSFKKSKYQNEVVNIIKDNIIVSNDNKQMVIDGYYVKILMLEGKPISELTNNAIEEEIIKFKKALDNNNNFKIKIVIKQEQLNFKLPFENLDENDLLYSLKESENADMVVANENKYINTYLIFYSSNYNKLENHLLNIPEDLGRELNIDECLNFINDTLNVNEVKIKEDIELTKNYLKLSDSYYTSNLSLVDTDYDISIYFLQNLANYLVNDDYNINTIVCDLEPISTNVVINSLNKSYAEVNTRNLTKESDKLEQGNTLDSLLQMINDVQNGNETIFDTNIKVYFNNKNVELLLEDMKKFKDTIYSDYQLKLNFDIPRYYILDQYKNKFIFDISNDLTFAIQSTTIAYGYPNFQSYLNDPHGKYLSIGYNGNYIFNLFYQNVQQQRQSFSMGIFGLTGTGKTALEKKLALEHITDEQPIIIADVEDEFIDLVNQFKGVNLMLGDENYSCNPLQIYPIDDKNNMIQNLTRITNFFKYHTSNFGLIKSQLEVLIREFFNELKITEYKEVIINNKLIIEIPEQAKKDGYKDFRSLHNNEFPILEDFLKYVKKEKDLLEVELSNPMNKHTANKKIEIFTEIEIMLEGLVFGVGGTYFNKHTNFEITDNLIINICLKTLLTNINDSNVQSYIDLVLRVIFWGQMNHNRVKNARKGIYRYNFLEHYEETSRLLILVDEEHRILDGKTIDFVKFFETIVRQCPKYLTALVTASHNIDEYYNNQQSEFGLAINNYLKLKTYKMFLRQDSGSLNSLVDLFKGNNYINPEILNRIFKFKRGEFLLTFGNKVLNGNVFLNPIKKWYIDFDDYEKKNEHIIIENETNFNSVINVVPQEFKLENIFND